ncbi:hypothetical protein GALMADRAFT_148851, partial [Galerina marginata CBS 339.88]
LTQTLPTHHPDPPATRSTVRPDAEGSVETRDEVEDSNSMLSHSLNTHHSEPPTTHSAVPTPAEGSVSPVDVDMAEFDSDPGSPLNRRMNRKAKRFSESTVATSDPPALADPLVKDAYETLQRLLHNSNPGLAATLNSAFQSNDLTGTLPSDKFRIGPPTKKSKKVVRDSKPRSNVEVVIQSPKAKAKVSAIRSIPSPLSRGPAARTSTHRGSRQSDPSPFSLQPRRFSSYELPPDPNDDENMVVLKGEDPIPTGYIRMRDEHRCSECTERDRPFCDIPKFSIAAILIYTDSIMKGGNGGRRNYSRPANTSCGFCGGRNGTCTLPCTWEYTGRYFRVARFRKDDCNLNRLPYDTPELTGPQRLYPMPVRVRDVFGMDREPASEDQSEYSEPPRKKARVAQPVASSSRIASSSRVAHSSRTANTQPIASSSRLRSSTPQVSSSRLSSVPDLPVEAIQHLSGSSETLDRLLNEQAAMLARFNEVRATQDQIAKDMAAQAAEIEEFKNEMTDKGKGKAKKQD